MNTEELDITSRPACIVALDFALTWCREEGWELAEDVLVGQGDATWTLDGLA